MKNSLIVAAESADAFEDLITFQSIVHFTLSTSIEIKQIDRFLSLYSAYCVSLNKMLFMHSQWMRNERVPLFTLASAHTYSAHKQIRIHTLMLCCSIMSNFDSVHFSSIWRWFVMKQQDITIRQSAIWIVKKIHTHCDCFYPYSGNYNNFPVAQSTARCNFNF